MSPDPRVHAPAAPPPDSQRRVSRDVLRLAGGSALFFSGRLGGAVLAYVSQVLLARWMGAAEVGRYVGAFAACTVLSTVCALGFPQAAMRVVGAETVSGSPARVRGFLTRGRQVTLLVSGVVAVCGAAVVWGRAALASTSADGPLLVAFLTLPALSMIRLHAGFAQAFSRFAQTMVPNTLARPALFLLAVAITWWAGGTLTATRAILLHALVIVVVLAAQSAYLSGTLRTATRGVEPEYRTREWLRLASPLLLVGLYANFFPDLNVVLVGLWLPPEQVAIFNAAFRTAFLIGFGIIAVDSLTLPRISQSFAGGDRTALQRVVAHGTLIKVAAGGLGAVLLALVGRPLLGVFGPEFVAGYPTLLLLVLAQLVRAAFGPLLEMLNVTGHQDASLLVSATSLVGTAVAIAFVAPAFGIEGAAVVVVAVTAASSIWMHGVVVRHLGIRPSILGVGRGPAA